MYEHILGKKTLRRKPRKNSRTQSASKLENIQEETWLGEQTPGGTGSSVEPIRASHRYCSMSKVV